MRVWDHRIRNANDPAIAPLVLVQALRASAASLVLVGHIQARLIESADAVGKTVNTISRFPGGFGVDLFFCISGFIMVVSSSRLFGTTDGRMQFISRRATRLIPLYYLVTVVYAAILVFGPRGYTGNLSLAVLASLAFIPYPTYGMNGDNVFPLFTLGWSLNYEVFFYLLFAIFISAPRSRAVMSIAGALVVFTLAGHITEPESIAVRFWSQPIILEFGLGMMIAQIWLGRLKFPLWICAIVALFSVALLVADPYGLMVKAGGMSTQNDFRRVVGWGLPAAGMLAAAVFAEKDRVLGGWGLMPFKMLGDASYSLYLIHPFVLIFLSKLWQLARLTGGISWSALGLCLLAGSISAAIAAHILLEAPVTKRLHRIFLPSRQRTDLSVITSDRMHER